MPSETSRKPASGLPLEYDVSAFKGRITFLMILCTGFSAALIGRAAYIQILTNPKLEQMARRQFQSKVLIRPRRGAILDRNGEPLAINVEMNSLAVNPSKIQNKKTLARLLAKATDIPYSKLLARLSEKKEFGWIKRHLTEAEMNRLKKWHIIDAEGDLQQGLWLVKESKRVYPHNELAAHILGSVNIDSEGLEGVELWQNEKMRGKIVSVSAIKDALGRPAFIDSAAAKDVREGKDGEPVSLTLDASLQFAVEEELRHAVHKANARSGTVIVMNAANGEILAMANQPAFNPNEKGASPDRRRNRALTDGYEPGSTMKAVLLGGALANGSKLTDQVYGERGQMILQGKKISEAEAHERFEWITLKKMIQVSSNIGAAKLALKLGADRYINTLKDLGFANKTGTEFPGEISGKVPPRKAWLPLSLANIGFGQGILVTPIQMTRAYASFINGGYLVEPTLLKNGKPQAAPRRVFPQKVSDQVLEALEAVTLEGGTGIKAALPGYRVAGKTGTAQKVDPSTGGYSRSKYIASFIGFPLNVEQKIVIFAMVDEPHGVYYASETAAPLFREVLNAVVNRFSIPASVGDARILASNNKKSGGPAGKASPGPAGVGPAFISDTLGVNQARPVITQPSKAAQIIPPVSETELVAAAAALPASAKGPLPRLDIKTELTWLGKNPAGKMTWKMPSLRGLTAREAIQLMKGHEFRLEVRGEGVIHTQAPEEGKTISDGETVRLVLADPL